MEESDVEQVTLALLDSANDKDPVVREQVRKSILTLGKQQPNKVLSMCQDYLVKHPKLIVGHRVVILQTIELIVKTKIDDISYLKIKSIISLASDEMTRSKDVVPDWQQAASNILVAVGNKYINDIMEEILSKFQPGILPHFFVVQTLASLSESNVYGMVPFLNAILGTMLPMLGMAKQDNMKWVFSSALSHFSESILEYLANLDKAPDPTVRKDTFSSEIYAAYDILYCSWLQSRESKLRLTVAEAVGPMSHLMAHDKLEEQLPKLIPTILSLYKKNTEHYVISKSLCQVLDASVNMGSRVLETQIDSLLTTLNQQVCAPVDYSNPLTVKNHNEVLRCFSILANTFPDRLVMFVLQKLENSNERIRMGSLAVLRHLINSSTSIMESKKLLILASIRQPLADHSNKVKKRVVQVISAMAHHGYLELEGGDLLVKFIIQHCALPDTYYRPGQRPSDPEEVTNEALRSMCDNTLHLFTTTVGRLTDVLWPMLLYYLTPGQYSNATAPLCKSLTLLGTKKRASQEPNFNIDFNEHVNLPSPHILMVRLLVNGSFPFRSRGHGAPSLSLLNVISPNIHPNAETLWEKEIPALLSYLEESTPETLDNKKWEESLLQFLAKSLVAIADDKWSCQLAIEATRYLSTYNQSLEEKSFLYRCIGVTLQQCSNKEVVQKQLQEMLISARHNDAIERAGVAMGIGLCASSHLDATLAKLDDFGKSDAFKKASGIFSLLKDKNDLDVEKMKSTLILCYGYVALHAPEDQILSRIDSDILRSISKHFNTKVLGIKIETKIAKLTFLSDIYSLQIKDLTMKLSLIQSVGLIARAISTVVRNQGYMFVRKQELMGVMMDFIKAEPTDAMRTPVRHLVMTTCANLINLEPALTENENFDMLRTCLNGVYGLPPVNTPDKDRGKDEEVLEPQQREELYKDTFNALQELLRNILARDLSPDGLQSVFKHIEEWLSSGQGHERERAMNTTAHILEFYFNNLHVKNMVTFHNLGSLLGRLAPRCTDPNPLVRRAAIDCIYTLLYIQLRYEGFSLDYKDDSVERLITLRESMDNPDHSVLYKTCSELAKIISKRLPQQQLNTLIFMLIEGLVDSQSNCSRASSVLLNTLLKNRGAGLQDLVSEMLEVLHIRLQMISEEQVKVSVAQSILILATQHLQTVINTLISYPLPFDSWSCEMWIALGADSKLASQIMEMLMEKLNIMVPYVDKKESMMRGGLTKVATSHPLAMTCALKEMMLNGQSQEAVVSLFPQLFSSLLVRLGSSVGVTLPKDINSSGTNRKSPTKLSAGFDVCGVAVEALRILLARAQLDHVVKPLDQEGAWDKMKDPQQHITGVTLLARAMAKHAGPRLPAIVECLCPCLNNIYECQRVTITAFFSELLNHHVVTELMMMDVLMNNMMERISDPSCTVRMLAVRGLGNIAVGSPEKVNKYAKELLAAMSSGMEEKDDPGKRITLEAMSGLSKVLLYLDKKNVQLLVVYIFMKIKPFLESENDEIRCASIMLLGNLSKFGSGEPVFKDQIHNVLVSLLLHLSDPNLQVVKACKYAMRVCAPVVGSELITTMFQNHLHEDKSLHYGEFINDLTKYIIQDFPGMLNFYHITVIQFFKSNWAEVRAGAAMFIGFLLGNLPEELFSHINMGSVTKGLVMLLQDPDPVVRVKAAEAMGHFH
ncbi:maestro heat-like repeat-containing protein family member 1 isoform X1 [Oncorhynchus mykiss]|uniref:maestro heat-like repeat-containing protein family member 1 isoform X1 n=2 Tax=Oncorhynchus TaxID=8016 RepID=UPI00187766C8|nr:maestro heat-like repeat-containing protein family member 1 isoform X1 [Oncorhynchus mykiss]XP_036793264.1 maestro heat-like repeat-containing protein family member 1 isoform X1 [Oncorhynchus mykiss]XP_036793267.1 maestro heat-like repeat-containing protein family member 1 isoform X1 [Oncorhynchus mykiss]